MLFDELRSAIDPGFPGIEDVLGSNSFVPSFSSFIRDYLDATRDRFFSIPYEVPENVYKLPGESDREACDRIASGTLVSVGVPSAFGSPDTIKGIVVSVLPTTDA